MTVNMSKPIAPELLSTSLTMTEMVAYQSGSVVSKTIIDKGVGTVTVFSFAKGEGLSEHTSPYDALVQVIDGEAEVYIAGQLKIVRAGQLIIMPSGKPHSLVAKEQFKMVLIMIRDQIN